MKRPLAIVISLCVLIMLLMAGAASAQEEPPPVTPPQGGVEQTGLSVYFYLDGELSPVQREVPGGGQMVEFTVLELLKGPSEEEVAEGYYTEIPEGVKLQYSTRSNDGKTYSVNLSREMLELQGDSERAGLALVQIEKTALDASGAETIGITIASDGMGAEPEDAYEALGVIKAGESEEEESEGGGGTIVLVVALVVGVLVAGLLVFLIIYIPRRRVKGSGGKHSKRKPASRSKKEKPSRDKKVKS